MNFSFLPKYWRFYVEWAKNTLLLAFFAVILGTTIGLFLSLLKTSRYKALRAIATTYIEFIRGTPLLVQLFIIYYGLQAIGLRFPDVPFLGKLLGVRFPDFMSGVITLGINSGAYVGEIFRAGIQAVDRGQAEAGRSLGLSNALTLRHIVIPQALRNILPALGNEFIVVIKESSIVSIIGIADLMYKADTVRGNTFLPFEPLIIAALMYFMMTYPLSKLMGNLEKRMRSGT